MRAMLSRGRVERLVRPPIKATGSTPSMNAKTTRREVFDVRPPDIGDDRGARNLSTGTAIATEVAP
jgi:hypothetical protein